MGTIRDAIDGLATTGVQRAAVDGQSVDAVPIRDLIEADKYRAANAAAQRNHRGLFLTKIRAPGAVQTPR